MIQGKVKQIVSSNCLILIAILLEEGSKRNTNAFCLLRIFSSSYEMYGCFDRNDLKPAGAAELTSGHESA